jgi:hypothetical protein
VIKEKSKETNKESLRNDRPRRSCTRAKKHIPPEAQSSDGGDSPMIDDYKPEEYDTCESEVSSGEDWEEEYDTEEKDETGSGDSSSDSSAKGGGEDDEDNSSSCSGTPSAGRTSVMKQKTIPECKPYLVMKEKE